MGFEQGFIPVPEGKLRHDPQSRRLGAGDTLRCVNRRKLFVSREARNISGSIARDHLANERTFLAWVRTSLAFVGLGILVAELVEFEGTKAELVGLGLVVVGAVSVLSATARYLRLARHLDEGKYDSSTFGPVFAGVVTTAVAILGAIFILS
jgi:putative membrane protein